MAKNETDYCLQCRMLIIDNEPFCKRCSHDHKMGYVKEPLYGACWFCEKVAKLSKEHPIPQWSFGPAKLDGSALKHLIGRPRDPSDPNSFIYKPGRLSNRNNIFGHWVRVSCEECNNGWMSNLQNDVKNTALRFIKDEDRTLSMEERRIMARWLAVIMACAEYNVGPPIIPQFQRSILMNKLATNPMWHFAYAKTVDEKLNGTIQICNRHDDQRTDGMFSYTTSAWVTIGKTVFYCVASALAGDIWGLIGDYPSFLRKHGLVSIWPPLKGGRLTGAKHMNFDKINRIHNDILLQKYAPGRDMISDDLKYLDSGYLGQRL